MVERARHRTARPRVYGNFQYNETNETRRSNPGMGRRAAANDAWIASPYTPIPLSTENKLLLPLRRWRKSALATSFRRSPKSLHLPASPNCWVPWPCSCWSHLSNFQNMTLLILGLSYSFSCLYVPVRSEGPSHIILRVWSKNVHILATGSRKLNPVVGKPEQQCGG